MQNAVTQITTHLIEFRSKTNEMLCSGDRFVIDYPVRDVIKWPIGRKVSILQNLEHLQKIYLRELTQKNTIMCDITSYMVQKETNEE